MHVWMQISCFSLALSCPSLFFLCWWPLVRAFPRSFSLLVTAGAALSPCFFLLFYLVFSLLVTSLPPCPSNPSCILCMCSILTELLVPVFMLTTTLPCPPLIPAAEFWRALKASIPTPLIFWLIWGAGSTQHDIVIVIIRYFTIFST